MLYGRVNLRRGDAREVRVYAGNEGDILLGDLVATTDLGVPRSATDEAWDTDLATTQTNFVEDFLGVALDKQLELCDVDHPTLWLVGCQGDYAFKCDALTAAVAPGQLVGPEVNDDGDGLLADTVVEVPTAARAIGVVAEYAPEGATELLVRVRSVRADRVLG